MRKATFTKTAEGYSPVNRRANKLSGGKTLDKTLVKSLAGSGLVSCYVWTNAGLRKVA